jgi:GNAT superfamily N-acetyltransferase
VSAGTETSLAGIALSNRQLAGAWAWFASCCPRGEVVRFSGVIAAFGHTRINFFNAIFLERPVDSPGDLDERLGAAADYGRAAGVSWFLGICDDWIPRELRAEADRRIAAAGFRAGENWTGMSAGALQAPERAASGITFRAAEDSETRRAVSDLNCLCYDAPIPWGRETIDRPEFWPPASFGSVAYSGPEEVSTATTLALDGCLYVALVATAPEYRGRGYAEAVMRHSLTRAQAASGLTGMALHATPAGLPLYRRMGFRPVTTFSMYSLTSGRAPH